MSWNHDQAWESSWWRDCANTYGEEKKQVELYAPRMGLQWVMDEEYRSIYNLELNGKNVLDIGGGPVSMLLKAIHRGNRCTVVDPLKMPQWVHDRYRLMGIDLINEPAETGLEVHKELDIAIFEEVWIYNCLQHTIDPKKIIENARKMAQVIRIFEWVDTAVQEGHPHSLHAHELDEWLGGHGRVEEIQGYGYTRCYYGVFPTR